MPLIFVTSFFTGAVLALQSYAGFSRFNAEQTIPSIVVISLTRELGPVITGLMIAGRVGASIAAEISTMKVTDQIDALKILSVDPVKYLYLPRLLATAISMPILVILADVVGIFGGYLISVNVLMFNKYFYIQKTMEYLSREDVISGLVKAFFFGLCISIISCYNGANSKGGSQGVGQSTTSTLVQSSLLVLFVNYIITSIFLMR